MDALQALVLIFTVKFSVNYCGSKRTIFFKLIFAKMRIFHDRQKFLTQKLFFGEKYMSLQCFAKFSAKIGHPGHCRLVNFPETPIFSKNDPNLRGKIEDRQKFLTKKIKEISAPKKTIFKKYTSYILFFTFWRMPGFAGAIAALTTT